MHRYDDGIIRIYFGDAQDQFIPSRYKQHTDNPGRLYPSFSRVCNELNIDRPIFLHQVHGVEGVIVSSQNYAQQLFPFSRDGDFLVTNLSDVGIGVVTADCLPVMLYDIDHHVVAAVHAGWRGAVQGVINQAIASMCSQFGSDLRKIKAIFGPGASGCCYEVQKSFYQNLEPFLFASEVIEERGERLFFDLPEFVRQQLMHIGVLSEHIDESMCVCTICHHVYCSHRRGDVGRNMSVIVLK